jgi:hypothetical protein
MNNIPDYIEMNEQNYKGQIKFTDSRATNEAYKAEVLSKTFNSYDIIKSYDEKIITTSLIACTNYYYTDCVKKQH